MAIVREGMGSEGSFRPLVALIAHEAKTEELISLVRRHRAALRRCRILTSQASAADIAAELARPVESVDARDAYGTLLRAVCEGRLDVVVSLRHPSELDVLDEGARLLRVCDLFEVVAASNVPTANVVLGFVSEATSYLVRSRHPSAFGDGFPWDPADRSPFSRTR